MPPPVSLIVNPAAGGGRCGRLADGVERALRGHGLTVQRQHTHDLEHGRAIAATAARAGETVVVLSGDGLIGAIADELRGISGAVLGILPGGRGNDLARVLGIAEDPIAACATIAHGVPTEMDLGAVLDSCSAEHGRAFVGIASAGFDSDANRIANEAPAWLGGLAYAYAAIRALVSWKPARFEIELDANGERRAFTGYSVGAANSRAYGGGMRAAAEAMLDDGLLEVVLLENVRKLAFVTSVLPRVFKGTLAQLPNVHVFRAAEVTISADRPFTMYADGDPIGELPVRVRGVPAAITVLLPPQAAIDSAFAVPPPPSVRAPEEDAGDAGLANARRDQGR